MILITDSRSVPVVAAELTVLYLALITAGDRWRRRLNSKIYSGCREFLAERLGLVQLRSLDPQACENGPGWKILPCSFAVVVVLMAIVYLFDGHLFLAVNAFATAAIYSLLTWYVSERKYVSLLARAVSMYQLFIIWVTPGYLEDPKVLFRGIIGRAVGSMVFFDALDESLLHMLLMTLLIVEKKGWDSPMAFLPLKISVVFLLPVQILGVREWICSQKLFAERPADFKRRFFFATLVPLITILFSFASGAEAASNHMIFFRLIGLMHFVLFVACSFFGDIIDQCIGTEQAVQSLEEKLTIVLHEESMEDEFECELSIPDAVFLLTSGAAIVIHSFSFYIVFIVLFLLGKYPSMTKIMHWRHAVLLGHFLMLCRSLYDAYECDDEGNIDRLSIKHFNAIVILTTLRVLFAFELRSFSKIQRDVSFFSAITAFAVRDNSRVALLSFLLIGSVAVSLVVTVAREHSARILKRENDSSAFLNHALKQKFSGVGGAVDSILETLDKHRLDIPSDEEEEGPNPCEVCEDSHARKVLQPLLEGVLQECRKGEHSCHSMNILRNIKQRTYRGQKSVRILREAVSSWREYGTLTLAHHAEPTFLGIQDGFIELELDWDLLRVFVCRWSRGAKALSVQCSPPPASIKDTSHTLVQLKFHVRGRQRSVSSDPLSCALLATELGGMFESRRISLAAAKIVPNTASSLHDETYVLFARTTSDVRFLASSSTRAGGLRDHPSPRERRSTSLDISDIPMPCEPGSSERPRFIATTSTASVSPMLPANRSLAQTKKHAPASDPQLPQGLRFAILDDNSLVRRNIERICRVHLRANEQHMLARGTSPAECWGFVDELLRMKIDVAIIDENLDFEEDPFGGAEIHISGREVARTARHRGFKGCLLCHSAQLPIQMNEYIFDGYIQKTASRQDFCINVARNWHRYQKQKWSQITT